MQLSVWDLPHFVTSLKLVLKVAEVKFKNGLRIREQLNSESQQDLTFDQLLWQYESQIHFKG